MSRIIVSIAAFVGAWVILSAFKGLQQPAVAGLTWHLILSIAVGFMAVSLGKKK